MVLDSAERERQLIGNVGHTLIVEAAHYIYYTALLGKTLNALALNFSYVAGENALFATAVDFVGAIKHVAVGRTRAVETAEIVVHQIGGDGVEQR